MATPIKNKNFFIFSSYPSIDYCKTDIGRASLLLTLPIMQICYFEFNRYRNMSSLTLRKALMTSS